MEYAKITFEHTKKMSEILREIGYKESKRLIEEIVFLSEFNHEKFSDPDEQIKRLQKKVYDFTKQHFDYFVEIYDAKNNPKYYNIGCFSEAWFKFIKEKISDPLDWVEQKIRYLFHGTPYIEEKVEQLIIDKKMMFMKDQQVLNKIYSDCVYIFQSKVGKDFLYKIGKTNNLEARKRTLLKEYYHELFLVNAINCSNSQEASDLEREIHRSLFEERRFVKRIDESLSNEWFVLSKVKLQYLAKKYDMVLK